MKVWPYLCFKIIFYRNTNWATHISAVLEMLNQYPGMVTTRICTMRYIASCHMSQQFLGIYAVKLRTFPFRSRASTSMPQEQKPPLLIFKLPVTICISKFIRSTIGILGFRCTSRRNSLTNNRSF
uniref:Histone acetyltransferase HAC1 n=1 Tax=Rhizophora mucronata TaxID=61149 RepID=A0A2P2MUL2_RHIMU